MELYIHIPFCRKKCEYCSFVSFPPEAGQTEAYLELLLLEANQRRQEITEPINTVFVGGGTPSLLTGAQFHHLMKSLREILSFGNVQEWTVEANPGTVTSSFLDALLQEGVNRVSVGMQSSDDLLLKRLGRIHSFSDVRKTVSLLQKAGMNNYNLDLIFGIPGQTMEDWKQSLKDAISLQPKHISAYGLIPEEGTPLFHRLETGEWELPSPDLERDMYDTALQQLEENGYKQYEISNFARKGCECIHNIGYWRQVPYIGLGISAASMRITDHSENGLTCIRRTNPSTLAAYARMVVDSDPDVIQWEDVTPENARFETMMLALRMNDGVHESAFLKMHGTTVEQCYGEKLHELAARGLMVRQGGAWKLTRRGMDIQNSILVELMNPRQ